MKNVCRVYQLSSYIIIHKAPLLCVQLSVQHEQMRNYCLHNLGYYTLIGGDVPEDFGSILAFEEKSLDG